MVWVNNDGLRIKFGAEEALDTFIGEYGAADPGSTHVTQLLLTPETLGGVGKKIHDAVRFAGANGQTMFLRSATIFVEQAFTSGGAATLTLGFDNESGTVFDADGIDATVALAALTAGATINCDGALVNTRLTNTDVLFLTSTVGTAAYTGGKGFLRLHWYLENQ